MFVSEINSIASDANIDQKCKTIRGERRGESPLFISMHRIEFVSNDSPYLFNLSKFFMETKNEGAATRSIKKPISAKSILNELIEFEKPKKIRKHLRELMDFYLLNHSDDAPETRIEIYSSFYSVDETLKKANHYSKRKEAHHATN